MATTYLGFPTIYLEITPGAFAFTIPQPIELDGIAAAGAPIAVGTVLMAFPIDGEGESIKPVTEASVDMSMIVDGVAETDNPVTETGPTSTLMKLTGIA